MTDGLERNDLPAGWTWAALGDITRERVDQSGPATAGTFTYVDIGSVDNKSKCIVDPKSLHATEAPGRARQRLRAGDVLVSMTRPNLNAVALIGDDLDGAIGSTGFHVLRPVLTASQWLFFAVQSAEFVNAMSAIVQGALYPAVRPKDIQSYEIPLPPLTEQRRIVAAIEERLDRLDRAADTLRRVRSLLDRYRAGVLAAAVSGRLVPTEAELARAVGRSYESGEELLSRLPRSGRTLSHRENDGEPAVDAGIQVSTPEGWSWSRLGWLLRSLRNGISQKPDAAIGTPILRISAVRPLSVNLEDLRYLSGSDADYADYVLNDDDLLFTRYNGNPSLVGVCGRVRFPASSIVHPDKLIRASVLPPVSAAYLEIALNVGASRRFIASRVRTTAGQAGIAGGDLKQVPVPLPPLEEQHRIVEEVDRRLSVEEAMRGAVEANLKRVERLRQAVLARAFAGKLVQQDPADEPASVLLERIRAERAAGGGKPVRGAAGAARGPRRAAARAVEPVEETEMGEYVQPRLLEVAGGGERD